MPRRGTAKGGSRARRLGGPERERQILEGAIQFFAERGFEGNTRDLAARLGVTQPLLYRYFPTKQDLVERVYREVFLRRWNPAWEALLADRARPLGERLRLIYRAYARVIFNYEWVRIFMFAGLRDGNINRRYLRIIQDHLFLPICRELRAEAGLPPPESVPVTEGELETCWRMHGGFYYMAIRKWVYHLPIPVDLDGVVDDGVEVFLRGAPAVMRASVAVATSNGRPPRRLATEE